MSIDKKIPKGMYAVCEWDPSNPEKSSPTITATLIIGRDAIYASEKYALWYANMRNQRWLEEMKRKDQSIKQAMSELEYFVMNSNGSRIS